MYDVLGCVFAFGFEIFRGDEGFAQTSSFIQQQDTVKHHASCLTQAEDPRHHHHHHHHNYGHHAEDVDKVANSLLETDVPENFPLPKDSNHYGCLYQFNPLTKEDFVNTLNNWLQVYLEIIDQSMKAPSPQKL